MKKKIADYFMLFVFILWVIAPFLMCYEIYKTHNFNNKHMRLLIELENIIEILVDEE